MTTPVNNGSSYLPGAGEGTVPQWPGVYAGTVVNNHDPLGVGRLQLNVPQVLGNTVSGWAVPAGTYYAIPTNGTPVSVTFLGGDPAQPLWNGPLDLNPLVESAAGPNVTYSASPPSNPKVGDIWYESIGGVTVAPQVWTFNSGTSTYSWVSQPSLGSPAIAAGAIQSTNIAANAIQAGQIAAGAIDGQVINGNVINGATINASDINLSPGSTNAILIYATAPPTVQIFTTSGTFTAPTGVTSMKVECIGGGAGSGGASLSGATAGGNGGTTSFPGDSVTVTAHGGLGGGPANNANSTAGGPGTGSTNSTHNDGGSGAAGIRNSSAAGGGASGGSASAGTSASGTTGGSAVTGGGPGANGPTSPGHGVTPSTGYGGGASGAWSQTAGPNNNFGGGGGGGEYAAEATLAVTPGNNYSYTVGSGGTAGTGTQNGAAGYGGMIKITYTSATPALAGAIAAIAGSDPYSNAFNAGMFLYETAASGNAKGGIMWNGAIGTQPLLALFPDSTLGFTGNSPYILGNVYHRGLTSESVSLALGGGASNGAGGPVMLELFGKSKDNTTVIPHTNVYSAGGNGWILGGAQTDRTLRTVAFSSGVGGGQVSGEWFPNANDAQTGTVYKITSFGLGTGGSAASTWYFSNAGFNETDMGGIKVPNTDIVGGNNGLSFAIVMESWAQVITPGNPAVIQYTTRVTISPNFNTGTTQAETIVLVGGTNQTAADTTASYGMFQAAGISIASSGTSGSITFYSSYIERLGP
jgi:hypothetical protein